MVSEQTKAILHRLYLSAFWPLLALAVVVPTLLILIYFHDRAVVAADAECYQWELAAESSALTGTHRLDRAPLAYSSAAAAKCNVDSHSTSVPERYLYSVRAWESSLSHLPPNTTTEFFLPDAIVLSVAAVLPVLLLVLGRWWLWWLTKPPQPSVP